MCLLQIAAKVLGSIKLMYILLIDLSSMAGVQPAAAAVLLPGEGDRGGGGGRHQPHHRPDLPQRHPPARARPCLDDRLQVLYLMYTSRSRYVIRQRRHHLHQCRCDSLQSCGPGGALSGANAICVRNGCFNE